MLTLGWRKPSPFQRDGDVSAGYSENKWVSAPPAPSNWKTLPDSLAATQLNPLCKCPRQVFPYYSAGSGIYFLSLYLGQQYLLLFNLFIILLSPFPQHSWKVIFRRLETLFTFPDLLCLFTLSHSVEHFSYCTVNRCVASLGLLPQLPNEQKVKVCFVVEIESWCPWMSLEPHLLPCAATLGEERFHFSLQPLDY